MTRSVKLGLIGAAISRSMAPRFHIEAGSRLGLDVSYELHPLPEDRVAGVPELVQELRREGYCGVNVTFPFKGVALNCATVTGPDVDAISTVNTLVFSDDAVTGHNTDYSGIVTRWRETSADLKPGVVALLGAGGVGRAAAFAVAELGATEIRVVDVDADRTKDLTASVGSRFSDLQIHSFSSAEEAVAGATGVFNATPVGMYVMPGSPVDLDAVGSQEWVFDVVYTPLDTPLTSRAASMGIRVFDGFDLFMGQGIDAFRLFTGMELPAAISAELENELRPIVAATN